MRRRRASLKNRQASVKTCRFFAGADKKYISGSFRIDLNPCVNEASAYADMKHSLRTYEVFATQI